MNEATQPKVVKKAHRLEKTVEIAASIEEVWEALTDGRKLCNWFPLEARVKPGQNGSIFVSWGPDCEGEAEIAAWEPGKKIAWQERTALVEFTLEARGSKTLVRLVQSGFFTGADWENEWFDSTDYGWEFMLLSLRVWLELHRGEERKVAWPRLPVSVSREQAYRRLLGKGGLFREDAAAILLPGKKFALTSGGGEMISGQVELVKEPRGVCLRVSEWNNALFWVTIEGAGGKFDAQVWISTFGLPQSRVEELRQEWDSRLKSVLK